MNRRLSCLAALVLLVASYTAAKLPTLSSSEMSLLTARFAFAKVPLPEVTNHPPYKSVRKVHPSLQRISAWISSMGAAATLTDLDGDGLPNDLVHIDPRTDLVTVTAVPGTGKRYDPFSLDSTLWAQDAAHLSAIAPMGTVAGDFNEDGLMDLLVYFWGRTPVMLLRRATITEPSASGQGVSPAASDARLMPASFTVSRLVESDERWYSTCATQADLDGDGHLDLVIGNYFQDGAKVLDATDTQGKVTMHEGKSQAANGGKDRIFLWQSASLGTAAGVVYREIPDAIPTEFAQQWAVALGAADLDGDLLPELYIANDFGPDRLLHNRSRPGQLNFTLLRGERRLTTPKSCVLGNDSFKGMGVDFGDVNGDGFLDIYVSNIATKFGLTESHFLWLSTGEVTRMKEGIAPYVHGSEQLGLSRSGFGWDCRLADFDNDGVLEAIQACGFIKGTINRWPELQALGTSNDQIVHNPRFWPSFRPGADLSGDDWNPFFVRHPSGRYYDLAPAKGLTEPMVSRGIAVGDVDGDGRLDFVAANQWQSSYFFKNESASTNAFLGLRLVHPNGSPAVGAVARLTLPAGRVLVAHVDGGNGHSGRRSSDIHFGLGSANAQGPLAVEIRWRDRSGALRRETMTLMPGRHTVALGSPETFVRTVSAWRPR